jgi:hypothetical protein
VSESKLDRVLASQIRTENDVKWIKEAMKRGTERMDKHDAEIRVLQHRQYWLSGAGAVVGAVATWVASHISVPRGILALAFIVLLPHPAHTHGTAKWIEDGCYRNAADQKCCNENDCAEVPTEDVAVVEGGYFIKSLGEFVPTAEATPSPDGHYWRCAWPTPADRKCCFFPPPSI